MKDFDNDIKDRLAHYKLEGYDAQEGWTKLLKRKHNKKVAAIRIISGIAAGLLIALLGYWQFGTTIRPAQKRDAVAAVVPGTAILPAPEDTAGQAAVGQAVALPAKPLEKAVAGVSARQYAPKPLVVVAAPAEVPEPVITVPGEPAPVKPITPAAVVAHQENKAKALPFITEEEFGQLVLAEEPQQHRRGKLATFFINKAAQEEYTVVQASSQPLLIN